MGEIMIKSMQTKLRTKLESTNPYMFNAYCIIAAFSTYFCMYAFRKPFSVGTFQVPGLDFLPDLDYKILIIISQVIGYTLSKFLGIKIVSEMKGNNRGKALIGLIAFAELALLLFAIVPAPYNFIFLFLNGIPLGMVWGLVFVFLEGRRSTELLGAGLSISYIVASGFVKSTGKYLMQIGVSEFWMPFATGMIFFPFLLLFVFMLSSIPKPTQQDIKQRVKRKPMYDKERWKFLKSFSGGLIPLTLLYMLLTAYRDFRDNFAREIWDAIGFSAKPYIFTISELPIALLVLVSLAAMIFIQNNKRAVMAIHSLMLFGTLMIGVTTWMYQSGIMAPEYWMISVGIGLYLAYVPYGCILFDRIIAATGFVGTAGFMIYVTDAFGYIGSIALLFYKNFGETKLSWLDFFIKCSYATSIICSTCFLMSIYYFSKIEQLKPSHIKPANSNSH